MFCDKNGFQTIPFEVLQACRREVALGSLYSLEEWDVSIAIVKTIHEHCITYNES